MELLFTEYSHVGAPLFQWKDHLRASLTCLKLELTGASWELGAVCSSTSLCVNSARSVASRPQSALFKSWPGDIALRWEARRVVYCVAYRTMNYVLILPHKILHVWIHYTNSALESIPESVILRTRVRQPLSLGHAVCSSMVGLFISLKSNP